MASTASLRRGALTSVAALALVGSSATAAAAVSYPVQGWVDTTPTYRIISVVSNGHLVPDAWGANRAEEAMIWSSVVGYQGDQWKFQDPARSGDGWLYYQIRNTTNNMCIKPSKNQWQLRTYLAQATCDTSASNQYWRVQRSPLDSDRVQFINRSSRQAFQPWDNNTSHNRVVSMNTPAAGPLTWWSLTAV